MATAAGVDNNAFINWFTKTYGATSPADWNEQAKKIAAGIIDPQEGAIDRAIAAKQKAAEGFQQGGIAVGKALGEMYAPLAGQVQQAYTDAGNRISGYAGGLTGEVGAQAQSAAQQAAAAMSRVGVEGGVPTQSGAAMNTANYLGGFLPASDLAAEAANRMTEMTGLGMSAQAGIAQQTLQQMRATQGEVEELRAQGLDLERTRPSEIAKALLTVRGEYREDVNSAFNVWKAGQDEKQLGVENTQWNKTFAAAQSHEKWTRVRTAAQDKASAKAAAAKEKREAAAFALQVQDYMQKSGKNAWAVAKQLSDATGWVYTVKNGIPVRTNQRTLDAKKQAQQAANAKTANRIRQQNANTAEQKAATAADKTKGTGGLTANQVQIRENTWMGGLAKSVDNTVRAVKTTNPITGKVTTRPAHMPPKKADLVRKTYNLLGPQLVGKIPRWTKPYLISLINAYINTLPNAWWDPKSYK